MFLPDSQPFSEEVGAEGVALRTNAWEQERC